MCSARLAACLLALLVTAVQPRAVTAMIAAPQHAAIQSACFTPLHSNATLCCVLQPACHSLDMEESADAPQAIVLL